VTTVRYNESNVNVLKGGEGERERKEGGEGGVTTLEIIT